MIKVNENYFKLKAGYLFPEISRRVRAFQDRNPEASIIRLGIGDVTEPLPGAVVEAMHAGVEEMSKTNSVRGYGPEQGYDFLREAIVANDFEPRGVKLSPDEIFVSDGSKCDSGNIQEIFGIDNRVAVTNPVYPVYVDTNVMAGRTGQAKDDGSYEGLVYLSCTPENGFAPECPAEPVDLIYLCYPNNPTGAVADSDSLSRWVEYARQHKAIILFDAAYEAFITDENIPHSIYEIPGAKDVAIEFRSFSKTAGFTGTRCAFTVVPKQLMAYRANGQATAVHPIWNRRHCTKFNGVSYPVQLGAAATYSERGKKEVRSLVDFYMANASIIRKKMNDFGYTVYGGVNAPYIWVKTPEGFNSWQFFDLLLDKANVVGTPGSGFGSAGEGFLRLSAFGARQDIEMAMERIKSICSVVFPSK